MLLGEDHDEPLLLSLVLLQATPVPRPCYHHHYDHHYAQDEQYEQHAGGGWRCMSRSKDTKAKDKQQGKTGDLGCGLRVAFPAPLSFH